MINKNNIPKHIAIIMDGNGRWAKRHSKGRIQGYKQGINAIRETIITCCEIGIKFLTLFAFSSENWKRPVKEVSLLMKLLEEFLQYEAIILQENNIKLSVIGNLMNLPKNIFQSLNQIIKLTSKNKSMNLLLALSYGGRDEIVKAVKNIVHDSILGKLDASKITNKTISYYLYTKEIPDPDLLIRTSGEYRISNFLLWQIAYTEFYFTDVLWPDFNKKNLFQAIENYQKRERRFGLIK